MKIFWNKQVERAGTLDFFSVGQMDLCLVCIVAFGFIVWPLGTVAALIGSTYEKTL